MIVKSEFIFTQAGDENGRLQRLCKVARVEWQSINGCMGECVRTADWMIQHHRLKSICSLTQLGACIFSCYIAHLFSLRLNLSILIWVVCGASQCVSIFANRLSLRKIWLLRVIRIPFCVTWRHICTNYVLNITKSFLTGLSFVFKSKKVIKECRVSCFLRRD